MGYHTEKQDYLAYKRWQAEQRRYRKKNSDYYSKKNSSIALTKDSTKESSLEKSLMCCSPHLGILNALADEICNSNRPEPTVQA